MMINLAAAPVEQVVHVDWPAAGVAIAAIVGSVSLAVRQVIKAITEARAEATTANKVAKKTSRDMVEKTDRIERSVNGAASAATERIEQAEGRIEELYETVLELQKRLTAATQRAERAEAPPAREDGPSTAGG